MRWDHLRLDAGGAAGGAELPLIERGAVARTFDTPEFRGMTFYEIHAKSIINRVPAASHVPFTWTINPYRGCSHACNYCLHGDTPVLMADGRTRPLRDLRAGDRIYGTRRAGSRRRYVITEVLDHWRTTKPAFRVVLEDGTVLIASGDHRFLGDRGWRHVTGTGRAGERRPHLSLGDRLVGTGRFAAPPKQDADYRRGYLCGMVRGGAMGGHHRHTPAHPPEPSDEWRKGFLAGMFDATGFDAAGFDAAGDGGQGALCISAPGRWALRTAAECLRRLGFHSVAEGPPVSKNGPSARLRLAGGPRERLRFFHTVDPASTRERSIEGMAAEGVGMPTRVRSIEPIGFEVPLYDITTGTGDFIADGVVSHNCFARKTHEYLDLDAGADFDSKIVVKVNAAERVRRELAAPRLRGEHIAMGTNVDCYQRAEGRYRLMPEILEALRDAGNPFSILTKGSLILRDLPILLEANERAEVSTAVSVGFVDRELWRLIESGTPAPQKRLEVCATLNQAGIGCGVLMGPVLPYLTDSPAQLEEAVRQIAEAGATSVSAITLHLRPGAREWFLAWLRKHHPELVVPYARLYGNRAYAPKEFQARISEQVRELAARYGIGRLMGPPAARCPAPGGLDGPEQLSLL